MNQYKSAELISTLFMYAMKVPEFSREVHRLNRTLENQKPVYYKVELSKAERRGKTPEEIQAMRRAKYDAIKEEQDKT